jgi:hypothetical protein
VINAYSLYNLKQHLLECQVFKEKLKEEDEGHIQICNHRKEIYISFKWRREENKGKVVKRQKLKSK